MILARIDPAYAKSQLLLLTRDWYMHPNGQLPAYEWAFGDVNPPVHAWAAWRVYEIDREQHGGQGDRAFLERVFHRLMLNFTWWVNRKDAEGRNIFQGGFLGLDNIGIFDRSAPLPTGGTINQSDGTAWMAMYTLNLMRIALELALEDRVYEDIASKFFEHFLYIAEAMTNIGGDGIGLWDETDEFYYDVLHLPDGERIPLRLRSMVGLIPLFAVEVLDGSVFARLPEFSARAHWFLEHRPQLAKLVSRWRDAERRRIASAVAAARPPHEAAVEPHARRDRIPVGLRRALAVQISREQSLCVRARRATGSASIMCRAMRNHGVRRQFQLARPDLVPGQFSDDRVAAAVSQLLRRRFQGRMPGRLGQSAASGRGRGRARRGACAGCSCATRPGAGRSSAIRRSSRTIRIFATICCFTNFSTATPARVWARRTKPAGPRWSRLLLRTYPTARTADTEAPPAPVEAALPEPVGAR